MQPHRFGAYAPTIARWEGVTGRLAPAPTITGRSGGQRLAATFVEWMMGLPGGYVTDHVPPNAALVLLGNSVVVQQAEAAVRALLADAGYGGGHDPR